MLEQRAQGNFPTYTNPVYQQSFPDPFVLKFCGEYFAYCTGFASDGNVFGVLTSPDLVHWKEGGGAMRPLENSPPFYWAPEVTYDNGKFYLYYSVGNETLMELRVAVSDSPGGEYVDSGRRLSTEDFAIDPHIFVDDDGEKYLFYATDFLAYQYIGTGTVVDRMIDWFTPAGEPRPVTRARFDWQVYDPKRKEKGGVRWHTVEGPAVLKRKDFYYEMFSGGNWQNATYGVSFAVSDTILRDDEWLQFADGERVLPILRTIPGVVMGPGHNCVMRGPNNRELYCIYHRWAGDSRVMAIDRMDNAGDRLFVCGASHSPQPAPFTPTITEMFRSKVPPENGLDMEGEWSFGPTGAITGPLGRATIRPQAIPESFLCEISWACTDPINVPGDFGIRFLAGDTEAILSFSPGTNKAAFSLSGGGKQNTSVTYLPADLVWSAVHLFRLEADGRHINVRLDSLPTLLDITLTDNVKGFELFFNDLAATVKSFELTSGFEELFENDGELSDAWKIESGNPINIHGGELVAQRQDDFSLVRENLSFRDLEFAVNVRLLEPAGQVALILRSGISDLFRMTMDVDKRIVRVAKGSSYELPQDVDLFTYHQLKIVKMRGHAFYFFDDRCLGSANVADSEVKPQFIAAGAAFAIEMIRVTAI